MNSMTISKARKQLSNLIDQTRDSHSPIHISGRRGGAVLVSDEDWSSIEETLYLLSAPGMRKSIKKGLKTPIAKCSSGIKF
jgi:prevent-host-death family protein